MIDPFARLRGYRYGLVLAFAIVAILFAIVAPDTHVTRGVSVLLQGTTLLAVVATGREEPIVRAGVAVGVLAALVALAVTVATSLVPTWIGAAFASIAVFAALVALVRGIVQLLRRSGVTLQAVTGALAIYLLVGLVFALTIGLVARLGSHPYFAQGTDGTQSEHVYFSFTAMTTTGFGDLTPATQVGRAIAVLEMLVGQIYLVTVIALLIGNLRNRRRDDPDSG